MKKISEYKKRKHLEDIIGTYLLTAYSLLLYYKDVAPTKDGVKTCNKSIKSIEEALAKLHNIEHIEVLDYLYGTFIGNSAIAYTISGSIVNSKQIKKYDTDKGVVELRQLMEENRKKHQEKEEQRIKNYEAVEKAKKEGKKVEMVWDKESKTVKPLIVEEKGGKA